MTQDENHEAYDRGYMQCRRDVAAALGFPFSRCTPPEHWSETAIRDITRQRDEATAELRRLRQRPSPERDTERLVEAVQRLNVDWDALAANCGDPKCEGDCRYVAIVRDALAEFDSGRTA